MIEVIFDPLIQKEVKNKNNIFELNKNYTKINTLKNILLIVGVIVLIVYYLNGVKLINILHFEKYKNFYEMSLGIEVCLLFYLSLKVKLNYINLFFSPNYRIYYSCFWIVITPLYFILSEKNIVVIRILYYVLYFFITNIIFKKLGGRLSEKNIHYDV